MIRQTGQTSTFTKVIALAIISWFYYQSVWIGKDWIFLDYINLAYHEAGHLFLKWAPQPLYIAGGSIGQLVFPCIISIHFLMKKAYFSSMIMVFWLMENGLNIARYMEDAVEMRLPLVGGHIHDWNWLFDRYRLLNRCTDYARILRGISRAGMTLSLIAAGLLLLWPWLSSKSREVEQAS